MTKPLKIAVAGLGTVGAGTLKLLNDKADLLTLRAGRQLQVTAVSARNRNMDRGVDISDIQWFDDAVEMARGANADVVVELIGGSDGAAKAVCETAFETGRHVVTANKALLAHHGTTLAMKAETANVSLAFEAAVAGGIPVIRALREGLAGNQITRLHGILNGTCNYILTTMRETGRDFADVLAEAQQLGYAEADPAFDIDGVDAAHKLALLSSVAFGSRVDFAGVYTEGISQIAAMDIEYAEELGYRIKLLGIAEMNREGIHQRVHPAMVPIGVPIAAVEGVFNAVVTEGDYVGTTVLEGRGAGAGPTASAVVGDLVDIACGRRTPTFGVPARALASIPSLPMDHHTGPYYVRLMVIDKPGVFADIAATLRDAKISFESVLQRSREPGGVVPVVLTTHETSEAAMQRALAAIEAIEAVREPPHMIRIERN
ncbi:MAG: homoserine dehydrogenase [Alphaproteobacteria bacterium]|nr:homoserine dehydrogenase [Alphaproteobacteria bacterium]